MECTALEEVTVVAVDLEDNRLSLVFFTVYFLSAIPLSITHDVETHCFVTTYITTSSNNSLRLSW